MVHPTQSAEISTPSIHRFMKAAQMRMEAAGQFVVNFTIGDPTQPIYNKVSEDMVRYERDQAKSSTAQVYTDFPGAPDFRQQAAEAFNKRHGTNYAGENVIFTIGANDGVKLSIQNLVEERGALERDIAASTPGNIQNHPTTLISFTPIFTPYVMMVKSMNRDIFLFDTSDNGYAVDFKPGGKYDRAVEEAYKRDKCEERGISREDYKFTFLFPDPGNPSSYKHSRKELEECRDLHNSKWRSANIALDSIYHELPYEEERRVTLLNVSKGTPLENNIVFIDSISKADSFASKRGGYVMCSDANVATRYLGNSNLGGNVHCPDTTQAMVVSCLQHREHYVHKNSAVYAEKSGLIADVLNEVGIMNSKTNSAFYGIMDMSFMAKVTVSAETVKAYQEFFNTKEAPTTVGNNSFLAAMEIMDRTGIVTVPILKPKGKGVIYFSEDEHRQEIAQLRIVPNGEKAIIMEGADRLKEYVDNVRDKGNVDYKLDLSKRQRPSVPTVNGVPTAANETTIREVIFCTPAIVDSVVPKVAEKGSVLA